MPIFWVSCQISQKYFTFLQNFQNFDLIWHETKKICFSCLWKDFYSILRPRAYVDVENLKKWCFKTNWIGMISTESTSIVPLKIGYILLFQFFFPFYLHKPIPSQNRTIFARNFMKLYYTYFWEIIIIIIFFSFGNKCLVQRILQNMIHCRPTDFLSFCLYAQILCKFQGADLSFVAFMYLVKTKRKLANSRPYKIKTKRKLANSRPYNIRKHLKEWTPNLDA